VYSQFSLSEIIILDRDSKFISLFWRELFKRTNTYLTLTAIYHFQIDDQNERTNQIMKIIFRYFLSEDIKKLSEWDEFFPEIEYVLNISVNVITEYIHFFLLYGVHPKLKINSISASYNNIEQFF
jgi:hypothetical protein